MEIKKEGEVTKVVGRKYFYVKFGSWRERKADLSKRK